MLNHYLVAFIGPQILIHVKMIVKVWVHRTLVKFSRITQSQNNVKKEEETALVYLQQMQVEDKLSHIICLDIMFVNKKYKKFILNR